MDVQTIEVDQETAEREYVSYRDALRTKRSEFLHDLKVAYGHMRHGRTVIDVWQAFADTGLDGNGDPKIAIAPADAKQVDLFKWRPNSDGPTTGVFCSHVNGQRWRLHRGRITAMKAGDVYVPSAGAYVWPRSQNSENDTWGWRTPREHISTGVPITPARFLPPRGLGGYHILWEVERWDLASPPKDPLLLKRVNPNVFVVLAGWELSALERAILRGRIA